MFAILYHWFILTLFCVKKQLSQFCFPKTLLYCKIYIIDLIQVVFLNVDLILFCVYKPAILKSLNLFIVS